MNIFRFLNFCHGVLKSPPRRSCSSGISVLMYHEVLDNPDVHSWLVVTKRDFEKQMMYLKANYDVLGINEAHDKLRTGTTLANGKSGIAVVTFDDGYAGNCSAALPIMRSLDIPFTLFCSTEAIESQIPHWYDEVIRALLANKKKIKTFIPPCPAEFCIDGTKRGERKWDEIQRILTYLKRIPKLDRITAVKEILDQVEPPGDNYPVRPLTIPELKEIAGYELAAIGAHSHTHDILVQLPVSEAKRNINTSRIKLRQWTGKRIEYFSYPNGDYSHEIKFTVGELGFKGAFTTEDRKWKTDVNVFTIPRIGIGRFDSFDEFKAKLSWTL